LFNFPLKKHFLFQKSKLLSIVEIGIKNLFFFENRNFAEKFQLLSKMETVGNFNQNKKEILVKNLVKMLVKNLVKILVKNLNFG